MDGCYQIFKAPARLLVSAHLACVLFIHGPGNYSGVPVRDSVPNVHVVPSVRWPASGGWCVEGCGESGAAPRLDRLEILHFATLNSAGYNWFKDLVSKDACVKALVDR